MSINRHKVARLHSWKRVQWDRLLKLSISSWSVAPTQMRPWRRAGRLHWWCAPCHCRFPRPVFSWNMAAWSTRAILRATTSCGMRNFTRVTIAHMKWSKYCSRPGSRRVQLILGWFVVIACSPLSDFRINDFISKRFHSTGSAIISIGVAPYLWDDCSIKSIKSRRLEKLGSYSLGTL